MEQVFDSEESSSSGCESGWTLYLQHDYSFPHDLKPSVANHAQHHHHQDEEEEEEDEEDDDDDDMSMVSDASSGPPHFQAHHQEQDHEDDEYSNNNDGHVFCNPPLMIPRKRQKIVNQTSFHSHRHLQDHLPDHDTASSPFFATKDLKVCNKEDDNSFGYSQGHSTTYFEMV